MAGSAWGIQNDGDLMYANGALWTATHHRIPVVRDAQQPCVPSGNYALAADGLTGVSAAWGNAEIGIPHRRLQIPISISLGLARSMGAYAEGPILDPKELRPALLRAVERVERGEVALLDTVTQPR